MSFTESNLLEGERIIYRARPHWCIFVKPALVLLFVILASLYSEKALRAIPYGLPVSGSPEFIKPVLFLIWFLSLVYILLAVIDYITVEMFVTNKRITRKKGIISRKTLDIKLSMIEAVMLNQGVAGRVFNYGHVYFTGVGAVISKFHGIYDPLKLRNIILKQIIPGSAVQQRPAAQKPALPRRLP